VCPPACPCPAIGGSSGGSGGNNTRLFGNRTSEVGVDGREGDTGRFRTGGDGVLT
jgi:hypothetical protein